MIKKKTATETCNKEIHKLGLVSFSISTMIKRSHKRTLQYLKEQEHVSKDFILQVLELV